MSDNKGGYISLNFGSLLPKGQEKPSATAQPVQDASQVRSSEGTELVLHVRQAPEKKPDTPVGGLKELYDKFKKLIYLFDCSGSMNDLVVSDSMVSMFNWTEDVLQGIKLKVKEAVEKISAAELVMEKLSQAVLNETESSQPDAEATSLPEVPEITNEDSAWCSLQGLEGEELKKQFLRKGLHTSYYISRDYSVASEDENTRLGMVKKVASKMIDDRVRKHPDADILAFGFSNQPFNLEAASAEDLKAAVSRLTCGGGTNIFNAVDLALQFCEKSPSRVNMHHIVLVTDAEDWSSGKLLDELPRMKKLNVVLDFIWITDPLKAARMGHRYSSSAAEKLQHLCTETGGEFVNVTTQDEFTQKFIAAATRLCLPPAPSK